MSPAEPAEIKALTREILAGKKYREVELPENTVRDLLEKELPLHRQPKEAVKVVKKKLHHIIAPYLGDPDYPVAAQALDAAFDRGEPEGIREACAAIMASHASTRERLPYLESFYHELFAVTGKPSSILDLACGLNPFALPWMGLPVATHYFAYDLNLPRIRLINQFFTRMGMSPGGYAQDILLSPPTQFADVAFFFKEAHRFDQRQRGCNRPFWQAIRARWLLVSLPTSSLSGKHDLLQRQRRLVEETVQGLPWEIKEVQIDKELVFCIDKGVL